MFLLFRIADYLGDSPNIRASRTASINNGDVLHGRGLGTSWSPFASVCKQWYRIYTYHKFTRPELAARVVQRLFLKAVCDTVLQDMIDDIIQVANREELDGNAKQQCSQLNNFSPAILVPFTYHRYPSIAIPALTPQHR